MKFTIIGLSTAVLIALAPAVFAQSANAPGHEMQQKGSKKGSPNAPEYAPGKETQDKSLKSGGKYIPGKEVHDKSLKSGTEYAPGKSSGSVNGGTTGSTTTGSK